MQRIAEIRGLYAYNRWANARVRDAIGKITPEEFSRDLKNSHPSLRDTVLHVMGAEWVWLARWIGTSPAAMPDEWHPYQLEQIVAEWLALETAQQAFLDGLSEVDLDRVVAYRTFAGVAHTNPLWQLLRHVVNHSTYHRGQITTMIRQLGHQPNSTDLVFFYREHQATLAT